MAVMGQNESKAPVVSAKELDREFLPRHVAIIMDGNGRWAQKRGMPRTFGHKAGVEALREIIKYSDELGIEALTIYAFSAENWKRSAEEVGALMRDRKSTRLNSSHPDCKFISRMPSSA